MILTCMYTHKHAINRKALWSLVKSWTKSCIWPKATKHATKYNTLQNNIIYPAFSFSQICCQSLLFATKQSPPVNLTYYSCEI